MPVGQILQRLYLREQNEGNNLTNRQQLYLIITALGDQVRLRDLPAVIWRHYRSGLRLPYPVRHAVSIAFSRL